MTGNRLQLDLVRAFEQHFGHPVPETLNESQAIVIIAASFRPRTTRNIVELNDGQYSLKAFRYIVQSSPLSLVQCCRDDQDADAAYPARPATPRRAWAARVKHRSPSYKIHIDEDIREFWLTHSQQLTSPIETFRFVYELYKGLATKAAEGLQATFLPEGQFSRQLAAIIAESGEWTRVFIPPGSDVTGQGAGMIPPSTRGRRDAEHRIAAFLRIRVGTQDKTR